MENHQGIVEDIRLFTFSVFCEMGCLFNRWFPHSTQISESDRHFPFHQERRMVSRHRPDFILPCEHSSRGTKLRENSTNMRQIMRQKADESPSPSCVTMKKLPFYDHKKDIVKAWHLASVFHTKKSFSFAITSDVAKSVDEQDYKLLLRFCRLDPSCEQDDKYPPKVMVHVNWKVCDTKGGPIPINITALCNFTSGTVNVIEVSSSSGHGEYYVVYLSLVKKLTVSDLMYKLKRKKPSKIQDTRSLNQEAKIRKANRVFHNARSLHENSADDLLESCRLSETERSKRRRRKRRPKSSRYR
ncbi:uncharacterized protein [Panulirus ornatus]|uniref:uncharacterized protein isoform X2 n=1 Tax=Panulirus ornatus TaxID=150431 RepID=UPI003A8708E4